MAWEQHAGPCAEHESCTAIVCRDDVSAAVAWVSHAPADDDVADRANADLPLIV